MSLLRDALRVGHGGPARIRQWPVVIAWVARLSDPSRVGDAARPVGKASILGCLARDDGDRQVAALAEPKLFVEADRVRVGGDDV